MPPDPPPQFSSRFSSSSSSSAPSALENLLTAYAVQKTAWVDQTYCQAAGPRQSHNSPRPPPLRPLVQNNPSIHNEPSIQNQSQNQVQEAPTPLTRFPASQIPPRPVNPEPIPQTIRRAVDRYLATQRAPRYQAVQNQNRNQNRRDYVPFGFDGTPIKQESLSEDDEVADWDIEQQFAHATVGGLERHVGGQMYSPVASRQGNMNRGIGLATTPSPTNLNTPLPLPTSTHPDSDSLVIYEPNTPVPRLATDPLPLSSSLAQNQAYQRQTSSAAAAAAQFDFSSERITRVGTKLSRPIIRHTNRVAKHTTKGKGKELAHDTASSSVYSVADVRNRSDLTSDDSDEDGGYIFQPGELETAFAPVEKRGAVLEPFAYLRKTEDEERDDDVDGRRQARAQWKRVMRWVDETEEALEEVGFGRGGRGLGE